MGGVERLRHRRGDAAAVTDLVSVRVRPLTDRPRLFRITLRRLPGGRCGVEDGGRVRAPLAAADPLGVIDVVVELAVKLFRVLVLRSIR